MNNMQLVKYHPPTGIVLALQNLAQSQTLVKKSVDLWKYQKSIHHFIENIDTAGYTWAPIQDSSAKDQLEIAKIVHTIARPLYRKPSPVSTTYLNENNQRVALSDKPQEYVEENIEETRDGHGAIHATRVALWTQLLRRLYEKSGQEPVKNPILLATAGVFHDVAREDEGVDRWDAESAIALEKLLKKAQVDEKTSARFSQTIREKDPKDDLFSTDEQRIVHDADCLDIMRMYSNFKKEKLCCSKFIGSEDLVESMIKEAALFIRFTKTGTGGIGGLLEKRSTDLYGDMVRILFRLHTNKGLFPVLTQLLAKDMEFILQSDFSNEATSQLVQRLIKNIK